MEKREEMIKENFANMKIEFEVNHHNDIVEIYLGDIELVSADIYNENQTAARVLAIILFSLAEVFAIAGYVVYMIFHRTSKDKKWI